MNFFRGLIEKIATHKENCISKISKKKTMLKKCYIKELALKLLALPENDLYRVYLISRKQRGIEQAYKAVLAYKAEKDPILAMRRLEKLCMSNPNGEP